MKGKKLDERENQQNRIQSKKQIDRTNQSIAIKIAYNSRTIRGDDDN